MPIPPFISFQPYDYVLHFGVQPAMGEEPDAMTALIVRNVTVTPMNPELNSAGTTGQRGLLRSQRARGGRMIQATIEADILVNAGFQALVQWALGEEANTTNPLPFATIAIQHAQGSGIVLKNLLCSRARISFPQGEVARFYADALAIGDWDTDAPDIEGPPEEGEPLLIDDLSATWEGVELPIEELEILVAQTIVPVYANNPFPVSFQLPLDRAVSIHAEVPPTDTTYALLSDLAAGGDTEAAFNVTVRDGLFTAQAPHCKISDYNHPVFDPQGITNAFISFAAAGDEAADSSSEITITIGA